MSKVKTAQQIEIDKARRISEIVAKRATYYRNNPQRFCKDYLNINLKLFQKILIYAMMHNYYFCFIACRGLGKTFLTALYCTVRAILFPGSKIVVASSTRSQGSQVLLKIQDELCKNFGWGSTMLRNEISSIKISQNECSIDFKNGSWIRVAVAGDSSRGLRGNVLVIDEYRLVDTDIINTVLRKFLTAPREPGYLNKKEYKNMLERNIEMYLSSAWYASSDAFLKFQTYFASMLDDTKKYFCCALPYQLSIREGLLIKEAVEDEMSEADFDPIKFQMEMEAIFFNDADGNFFSFKEVAGRRSIKDTFLPLELYTKNGTRPPKLKHGENRILSVDVALMSSKKNDNDASSLIINSSLPTNNDEYIDNFVYLRGYEGLTTDELGLNVMRTFYEYNCTHLVLDCQGNGLGVYDFICKDRYDPQTGNTYKAMKSLNDESMAERCKVKDANSVVYTIKASAQFNSEISTGLRNGFINKKINLPIHEFDGESYLRDNIKGWSRLDGSLQAMYKINYIQTSLMINELVNLEYEVKNGNVKISEKSGFRKDRYSSAAYNYWASREIERSKKKKNEPMNNLAELLVSNIKVSTRKIGMFD